MEGKIAIIIGAGPAGLTAAYELLTSTDYIPVIIEADAQVGGLSKTVDYKGNKIDIGGHRFFSKSQRVIDWWLRFLPLETKNNDSKAEPDYRNTGVAFHPLARNGDPEKVMLVRRRKSRILFSKKFFDYPLTLNFSTFKKLGFLKLIKGGGSYLYAKIFPIKHEENLAHFFRNRFGNELYLTFFKDYTEKVWGVKCSEIPAEWGRQRVKDLNITKVLTSALLSLFKNNNSLTQRGTSTSLIEQFLYPKYGPGQMWETVAEELTKHGGILKLNTRVAEIQFREDGSIASVLTKDKHGNIEKLFGEVFFSTMPVRELIQHSKYIQIPKEVLETARALQYRDFLIVGLLVDKLLLTDNNASTALHDNWIYLQDKGIKAGRLQIFNNWSPGMVTDADKIWMGVEFFCSETEPFWHQTDEQIIAQAVKEMEQTGLINILDVKDAVVLRVLKAYPSYYGAYERFNLVKEWLTKISNLYCIGRNGMHKYNNSDHSMLTAMEAVKHLKVGGDKKAIWDINTEEAYHEEG